MTETAPEPLQKRLPEELASSALFMLKRLGMAAKERAFVAYDEIGLRPYHHAILAVLDQGSSETQGAIAEALGYDKGQLVGLLDELEEGGYVKRQRDPADRRRQIVQITPSGRKALERVRQLSQQLEDEFLATLDERERRDLQAILQRLGEEHLPACRPAVVAKP
jgi:DNA-binding MarR family transcriptional regulator